MVRSLLARLKHWMILGDPRRLFCKVGMHGVEDRQRWVEINSNRVLESHEIGMIIIEDLMRGMVVKIGEEKLKIENWCPWHRGWY